MSERPIPGSARVTRRAIAEVVRAAVLESYGVTGLADADLPGRVRRWLGRGSSGVRVDLRDGIAVELFLTVAYGVPVAEVVRQVESAVRYALRRALGRELDTLVVHVGGLSYGGVVPAAAKAPTPSSHPDAAPLLEPRADGEDETGGAEGPEEGDGEVAAGHRRPGEPEPERATA